MIRDYETNNLEFKEVLSKENKISWLKKVCAFSNEEQGGTLIVGVDDSGKVIGISDVSEQIDLFTQEVRNCIDPRVIYSLKVETMNEKEVLIIKINYGSHTPYTLKETSGRHLIYVMQGNTTVPAEQSDLVRLVLNSSNLSWDSISIEGKNRYTFSTLINKYLLIRKEEVDEKILREIEMLKEKNITNAGILFSDQNTNRNAYISVTRWPGLDKSADYGIVDKEFKGSILNQIDNALEFISIYNKTEFSFPENSPQRITELEYDDRSIKEALTNAVIHRDYSINNNIQVEVGIYDNRIEIKSTGSLMNSHTLEDLLNLKTIGRRNPLVCNIMKDLDYIESKGRGISRIIEPRIKWRKEPEFYVSKNFFQVTLYSNFYYEESDKFLVQETLGNKSVNYDKFILFLIREKYISKNKMSPSDTNKTALK